MKVFITIYFWPNYINYSHFFPKLSTKQIIWRDRKETGRVP